MNNKSKLLIIDLGKAYGGMEKQVESLIVGLENEFDITLAINSNGEFIEKSSIINNCKVIQFNNSIKTFHKTIFKIIKYVKQEKVKVVHCNGTPANIVGIILNKVLKVKFISAVHSDIFYEFDGVKKFIYKIIEGITAKYANSVVAVSNDLQEKLRSRHRKYYNKFVVVYNGVTFDNNSIKVLADSNKFKILFVGRLVEIKNIKYLLDSLHKLKEQGVQFECDIIGEGELKDELIKNCIDKNIGECVNFLGFRENIQDYMLKSDLLVMTSKMEGIPLVIIEAFANKLPVVASAVGGICEMIQNNYNGILFNLDGEDELTKVFLDIFNDKYDLKKIRETAYEEYKNKWTREVMIKKYKSLYL